MKKNLSKKLFGLTLTAALALTTLTACGNDAGTAASPEHTRSLAYRIPHRRKRRCRHRPAQRESGD